LFASQGHDVRKLLRQDKLDDVQLEAAIAAIWRRRDDRYSEIRSSQTAGLPKIEMSYIGG
jgi:cyclic pyranopterin phosphate synthase